MAKDKRTGRSKLKLEALEPRMVLSGGPLVETGMAIALNDSWTALSDVPVSATGNPSYLATDKFAAVSLNEAAWRSLVTDAPLEFTPDAAHPLVVELPNPSGQLSRFAVVETVMMEPELAAKFPAISTYAGVGIDDPLATLRFDLTYQGFHAQVRSPQGGYYIDPIYHLESGLYASYYREDSYCKPQLQSSMSWSMTSTMITHWKSRCP